MSQPDLEQEETSEVWLDQMHVFPEAEGVYEHDAPYVVQFEATTGVTRTVKLSDEEADKIRDFNKLPKKGKNDV